jgi:hypothetical protein
MHLAEAFDRGGFSEVLFLQGNVLKNEMLYEVNIHCPFSVMFLRTMAFFADISCRSFGLNYTLVITDRNIYSSDCLCLYGYLSTDGVDKDCWHCRFRVWNG